MDAFLLHMECRKTLFAGVNQRSHLCEHAQCLACPLLGVEGKMKGFIDRILSCLGAWAPGILQNCMSNIIGDFIVSPFSLFFRRTIIPL